MCWDTIHLSEVTNVKSIARQWYQQCGEGFREGSPDLCQTNASNEEGDGLYDPSPGSWSKGGVTPPLVQGIFQGIWWTLSGNSPSAMTLWSCHWPERNLHPEGGQGICIPLTWRRWMPVECCTVYNSCSWAHSFLVDTEEAKVTS